MRRVFTILVCCLLLAPALRADAAGARVRVLAVKTRDLAFYGPTLQAFRHGLDTRGYHEGKNLDITVIALTGDDAKDQQAFRAQLDKRPNLIFTLGTNATRMAADLHPDAPVVFSMVLDPVALGVAKSLDAPGGGFTGTTLLVSPGKQLEALIQVVPQARKVGVLYTEGDATSQAFLSSARDDAKRLNLEIVARSVGPDKDAARKALDEIAGQVSALWLIPDPASSGAQAITETFEAARNRRLPVLGASGPTVRAGALLALSADLADLGDQSAELAAPLLDGSATAAATRVRGPRRTLLSVSLVSAQSLGLTVPDSVLHLADEVIDK